MVAYFKSDLEFILAQSKVAEDHARYERTAGAQGRAFGPNGSIPTDNLSWCRCAHSGQRQANANALKLVEPRVETGEPA